MINLIGSALLFITVILLAEYIANKNRVVEPEPVKLSKNEWTTDELVFLANNYGEISAKSIAKEFNNRHSVNAIYKMAKRIILK